MNLEALIEDLEAQGYFASAVAENNSNTRTFCKSALLSREKFPDVYLAMPLLGKDFVAGFQNRITRSSWLLIHQYIYLVPQDHGTEIQITKLSMKDILEAHLIGVPLRISFANEQPELPGYVIRVFSNMIEFVTFEAVSMWVPISQVNYLVVDKLSMKKEV